MKYSIIILDISTWSSYDINGPCKTSTPNITSFSIARFTKRYWSSDRRKGPINSLGSWAILGCQTANAWSPRQNAFIVQKLMLTLFDLKLPFLLIFLINSLFFNTFIYCTSWNKSRIGFIFDDWKYSTVENRTSHQPPNSIALRSTILNESGLNWSSIMTIFLIFLES